MLGIENREQARASGGRAGNDTPLVSVIVPVYRVEAYLDRCVSSVLEQDGGRLELILVDDGSPDRSGMSCDRYAARDGRLRVIHIKNGGVSAARNAGLAAAAGAWVLFLDADDALLPNALARLAPYLSDELDAVCGLICRGNDPCWAKGKARAFPAGHALADFVLADPTNYLTIHAWLFRRLETMPRFDPALEIGEDSDWVLRYLAAARRTVFAPVPVYRYTMSVDSSAHTWRAGREREFLRMMAKLGQGEAGKEKNWPLFILINFLLMLTYVVFHPGNPNGRGAQLQAAKRLREEPLIARAFEQAELSGLSAPKRALLESLKRRRVLPAYTAIKLRQLRNAARGERR